MTVYLNGQYVDESQAKASVFDRSFNYADGVFETLLVHRGIPFAWSAHLERLKRGADFLGIRMPLVAGEMREASEKLVTRNGKSSALLRIQVSRGVGQRGYSPKGADSPLMVISVHEFPARTATVNLVTSRYRLFADDTLLQHKTCNKLLQVLARREADAASADDALLYNHRGDVTTATSANIFWIFQNKIYTPPLTCGALPGITRAAVRKIAERSGIALIEQVARSAELQGAEALFLSSTGFGIVPVAHLDGRPLRLSSVVKQLSTDYERLIQAECQPKDAAVKSVQASR